MCLRHICRIFSAALLPVHWSRSLAPVRGAWGFRCLVHLGVTWRGNHRERRVAYRLRSSCARCARLALAHAELKRVALTALQPNYSVKWTAANRRGIFMQLVAAATYLKR